MSNKITQADRDSLIARAAKLVRRHGRQRMLVIEQLINDTGVSRDRAIRAYGKAIRKLNRP